MLRHAKAEDAGGSDLERRLTERGRLDAHACGRWLAAMGVAPDLALVSAAARTQETWSAVCDGGRYDASLGQVEPGLYDGGPEAVLESIRLVDEEVSALVVVGHNPTMQLLSLLLDDGTGVLDPSADFPTCTAVVFDVDAPWDRVGSQTARATARQVARA